MDSTDENTHAENVTFIEILSDLPPVPPQIVADDDPLRNYLQLSNEYEYIKPPLHIEHDILPNTAGTVALQIQDVTSSETVSLVCYQPNSNSKQRLTETAPYGSIVLGTNNPAGKCYAVDESLQDGITLFFQTVMIDEQDDTTHVIVNKFVQTVRKLAETRQLILLTTADKKHDLVKSLKGANVIIYSTIQSVFVLLEEGNSLDMALEDADITYLQETVIQHENGFIERLDDGLYFVTYNDDDEVKHKTFICSSLTVLARSRDVNSNSWGLYIEWQDFDGITHRWALPAKNLQGDSSEYRKELASQGLKLSPLPKALKALDVYLTSHPTENRAICVNQVGWYGDSYVLPHITINTDKQVVVYQPDKLSDIIYSQQGSLDKWKNELCKPLAEQSRIAFAISCAFSGQLLELLGADSGGFHIVGGSSMGKSIGLKVAGSVWGNPDKFIKSWRVTDNGLESVASTHNDSFLGLDEISEGDPKAVGNSAYMLANGQGKVRAKAGGGNRQTASWRLMFLSNGEKTLNTYLKTAGIDVNAGQLVRLIHIDADAGLGFRSFDSLVMADTAEQQANIIKQLSTSYYGTAGMAWLEYLTKDKQTATVKAKELTAQFMSDYTNVKEQAHRVAERFAIVATAGEMATMAGITGWQDGQAIQAVKSCFDNWLDIYGSDGSHEDKQIIKQVQSFIEQHGSSRFQPWHKPAYSDDEPKINNRVGWRKQDTNQYLFYKNSFAQVCGTYEVKKVIQVLNDAQLLDKNENGRDTFKIELPDSKNRTRMYAVKNDILIYDSAEITGTAGTAGTAL